MPYEPWRPGMRVTASRLLAISPTWQDWTPVWTTTTGANTPSFGTDSTVVARYAQSALTVFFRLEITFGATANFGGGSTPDNWNISVPVPAAAGAFVVGYGEAAQSSIGSRIGVRARLDSASTLSFETAAGRVDGAAMSGPNWGLIDALTPWTWTAGNVLRVEGTYEAAA